MALKKARRELEEAALTITSMMDMMTIILVFLLKSYSTTDISVKPDGNLTLPASSSVSAPTMAVQVLVAKNRIMVDDNEIFQLEYDQSTGAIRIPDNQLDLDNKLLINGDQSLKAELQAAREGVEAGLVGDKEFEGKILLQIDRDVPFDVIHRVMYTAGQEQFGEFQFVVIKTGE
jgi:biopolymer transport protein ExbD